MPLLLTPFRTALPNEKPSLPFLFPSPHLTHSCACRCYVDDKVSKVAWLNRSNIIFAGQDKWSLDPRVDLVTKGQLEYSLRIQKVILKAGLDCTIMLLYFIHHQLGSDDI